MRSGYVPLVLAMLLVVVVALTATAQPGNQQPSAMDSVEDLLDHAMSSALAPIYSETWSIFGNNPEPSSIALAYNFPKGFALPTMDIPFWHLKIGLR